MSESDIVIGGGEDTSKVGPCITHPGVTQCAMLDEDGNFFEQLELVHLCEDTSESNQGALFRWGDNSG